LILVKILKLVERIDKNVSFKTVILPPLGLLLPRADAHHALPKLSHWAGGRNFLAPGPTAFRV